MCILSHSINEENGASRQGVDGPLPVTIASISRYDGRTLHLCRRTIGCGLVSFRNFRLPLLIVSVVLFRIQVWLRTEEYLKDALGSVVIDIEDMAINLMTFVDAQVRPRAFPFLDACVSMYAYLATHACVSFRARQAWSVGSSLVQYVNRNCCLQKRFSTLLHVFPGSIYTESNTPDTL